MATLLKCQTKGDLIETYKILIHVGDFAQNWE